MNDIYIYIYMFFSHIFCFCPFWWQYFLLSAYMSIAYFLYSRLLYVYTCFFPYILFFLSIFGDNIFTVYIYVLSRGLQIFFRFFRFFRFFTFFRVHVICVLGHSTYAESNFRWVISYATFTLPRFVEETSNVNNTHFYLTNDI